MAKMAEPFDTDALRDWAVDAQDIAAAGGSGPNMLQLCASNLTAAADELERLRKDVAFWIEQSDIWKRLANDERDAADRLRTVISDAPHGVNCNCSTYRVEGVVQTVGCTCWKAGAL